MSTKVCASFNRNRTIGPIGLDAEKLWMVFGQTSPVEHLNQDENTVERIRCNLGERFVFHHVFPGNDHISPSKEFLKMSFLFPRWDMLLPLPRYLKGGHVTTTTVSGCKLTVLMLTLNIGCPRDNTYGYLMLLEVALQTCNIVLVCFWRTNHQ